MHHDKFDWQNKIFDDKLQIKLSLSVKVTYKNQKEQKY